MSYIRDCPSYPPMSKMAWSHVTTLAKLDGTSCLAPGYAMVTNHLRAPYGVYFTKNRTILRRPYSARLATGRRVRFF